MKNGRVAEFREFTSHVGDERGSGRRQKCIKNWV